MPRDDAQTVFGLLRHAQTEWNRSGRIQGHLDSPLTKKGEADAEAWGRAIAAMAPETGGFARILASDLGRTARTAELVNRSLGLPVSTDSRLREQDWGDWSGLSLKKLRREHLGELEHMESQGWNLRPPGGESRREVLSRCLESLAEAARTSPGEAILVVAHQGVLNSLVFKALDMQWLPAEGNPIKGYYLHRILLKDGRPEVDRLKIGIGAGPASEE